MRQFSLILFSFFSVLAFSQSSGSYAPKACEQLSRGSTPDPDTYYKVDQYPQAIGLEQFTLGLDYGLGIKNLGIGGTVVLNILVDAKGNYVKHEVVVRRAQVLLESVEADIQKLKFEPGICGGSPISCWVKVPFRFTAGGKEFSGLVPKDEAYVLAEAYFVNGDYDRAMRNMKIYLKQKYVERSAYVIAAMCLLHQSGKEKYAIKYLQNASKSGLSPVDDCPVLCSVYRLPEFDGESLTSFTARNLFQYCQNNFCQ